MSEVGDIAECAYCAIDFVVEKPRQTFCTTKACQRDRQAERMAKYGAKISKESGYKRPLGDDPTNIRPNLWRVARGRRPQKQHDKEGV